MVSLHHGCHYVAVTPPGTRMDPAARGDTLWRDHVRFISQTTGVALDAQGKAKFAEFIKNLTCKNIKKMFINIYSSIALKPVLNHFEKLCIASYHIQFPTNMKMYNHKV